MNWQAGVGRVVDRAQSARGPVGSLTNMVGAGILNQRVLGMAGRHSASFSIPVPPELHRRWTASGVFPRIDPELHRDHAGSAGVTATGATSMDHAAVRAALERARDVLWRTQRRDGAWESPGDMGPIPTAQVMVALRSAGGCCPRTRPTAHGGCARAKSLTAPTARTRPPPRATSAPPRRPGPRLHCARRGQRRGDRASSHVRRRAGRNRRGRRRVRPRRPGGRVPDTGRPDQPSELPCPPMLPALLPPLVRFMERRSTRGS